jgi:hypothetical protein
VAFLPQKVLKKQAFFVVFCGFFATNKTVDQITVLRL